MRALILLIAFAAATVVPSAEAHSPTPVLGGCTGKLLVRPSEVDFCGDGNFTLISLKWSLWTTNNAAATGQAYQNDCTPFCAAGHFHFYRVVVNLFRPRTCSNRRREFTRLRYEYVTKRPPDVSARRLTLHAPLNLATRCP